LIPLLLGQGFGDDLTDAERIEKVELVRVKPNPLSVVGLREPMLRRMVKVGAHPPRPILPWEVIG
jgi:hypothetical protein